MNDEWDESRTECMSIVFIDFNNIYVAYSIGVAMAMVSGCFLLNKTRPSTSSYQTQERKIHPSPSLLT